MDICLKQEDFIDITKFIYLDNMLFGLLRCSDYQEKYINHIGVSYNYLVKKYLFGLLRVRIHVFQFMEVDRNLIIIKYFI